MKTDKTTSTKQILQYFTVYSIFTFLNYVDLIYFCQAQLHLQLGWISLNITVPGPPPGQPPVSKYLNLVTWGKSIWKVSQQVSPEWKTNTKKI